MYNINNLFGIGHIKRAAMEKKALNAHQLIQQLRSAAIKTNLGIMPDALNRAWINLSKRNKAVKAVEANRQSQHLAADKLFNDIAVKNGMDPLDALNAGRDGKLTGELAAAFKERQRTGNRVPLDVFLSERNPMGMVRAVNDLKLMENMTYPLKSRF